MKICLHYAEFCLCPSKQGLYSETWWKSTEKEFFPLQANSLSEDELVNLWSGIACSLNERIILRTVLPCGDGFKTVSSVPSVIYKFPWINQWLPEALFFHGKQSKILCCDAYPWLKPRNLGGSSYCTWVWLVQIQEKQIKICMEHKRSNTHFT